MAGHGGQLVAHHLHPVLGLLPQEGALPHRCRKLAPSRVPVQTHELRPDEGPDLLPALQPSQRGPDLVGLPEDLDHGNVRRSLPHRGRQGVDPADELANELGPGREVQLFGRPCLSDRPLAHDHDPIGDGHGLLLVVGHVDRGDAQAALEAADLPPGVDPQLGVEIGQGLVEEQHLGLDDDGPGQRDALLLAPGDLVRELVLVTPQAHQLEHLRHPPLDVVPGHPLHLQPVGDVLEHRQVRKQGVVLEHEADVATVGHQGRDVLPGDAYGPLVGLLEAGDDTQGGGLAAPGGPEQGEKLPGLYLQAHPIHGGDPAFDPVQEALANALQADVHCLHVSLQARWPSSVPRAGAAG